MDTTYHKWLLHCTNPECGHSFDQTSGEPDVICRRCGGFVEVNERISYTPDFIDFKQQ